MRDEYIPAFLELAKAITRNAVYTDTTAIGAGEVKVKLSRAV